MSQNHRPQRVLYYGVHDVDYPRNQRIRRFLAGQGHSVSVVSRARLGGRLRRAWSDLTGLVHGARSADVIVLSEFRLTHAPLVWLVARLVGARVVVDGFVGLHETAVGDHRAHHRRSLRARVFEMQDRLALAAADLFLIDTEVRAEAVRAASACGTRVLALPVGAPAWAIHRRSTPAGPLRILYYGNYIPLHGLDVVVDALDELAGRRAFHVTLLGDGALRPAVERRVRASLWSASAAFREPVPEQRLADVIADADVVLGVFGSSEKAGSVIANKVWQGLACGRPVVTQDSPALADLPEAVSPLLAATAPGDAHSLAQVLADLETPDAAASQNAARALEASVAERFEALDEWIQQSVSSGRAA